MRFSVDVTYFLFFLGLRASILLLGLCNFFGTAFQAIPLVDLQIQTWLAHTGMFLSSIGGPVAMALGPLISAIWFPPDQRTTSTAIASLSSYAGAGMAFIIGPLLVPDVGNHSTSIGKSIDYISIRKNMTNSQLNFLKEKIMFLMYIELGTAVLILLLIVVYFPKKPPLPPCLTAASERLDFKDGFKHLMFNKQFLLLLFINGMTLGIYSGWTSILDLTLSQFGLGEKTAGWLGFGSSVSGILAAIILSR